MSDFDFWAGLLATHCKDENWLVKNRFTYYTILKSSRSTATNILIWSCSWLNSSIFKWLCTFTRWRFNFLKWTLMKLKILLQSDVNPIQQTKLDRVSYFFVTTSQKWSFGKRRYRGSYAKIWNIWSNDSPYMEAWTKWGLKCWYFLWCIIKKEGQFWSEEKMGRRKRSSHGINSITRSTNVRLIIFVYWDCKDFPLEIITEWRHKAALVDQKLVEIITQ